MKFRYKKTFLKRFDHFSSTEKDLIISADKEIRKYYLTNAAPYGLRIKKLYDDNRDKIFEARVSDKIRIIWLESEDLVTFALLGSHDEVKRYLKSLWRLHFNIIDMGAHEFMILSEKVYNTFELKFNLIEHWIYYLIDKWIYICYAFCGGEKKMITVKQDTTLVGVSELRTNIDKILQESKKHKVLIERRNKPVAVLLSMERYGEIEEILEALEDVALGYLAKERETKSKPSDYLNIDEVQKKISKK